MTALRLPCVLLLLGLWTAVGAEGVRAQAGLLRGTVRDEAGRPLPGVHVVLSGTGLGDATETDGSYRIEGVPAGRHTLAASAIGYRRAERPVSVPEGAVVTLDLVLQEAVLEGSEVVVTAARRAEATQRAAASISVLTPRELEARNLLSLDEALRYVPGVQLAGNQVNVRGSSGFSYNTGSRVLLLVDGLPLMGPESGSIPFEALPMSQVARVEVLKGPGSALYGGSALGGVINVLTKDFPERPETSVRLFGGLYEPVRYRVWREAWAGGEQPRPLGGAIVTHARRAGEALGGWVNLAYFDDAGYTNFGRKATLQGYAKLGWRPAPALRLNVFGGLTWRKRDQFLYWNGARDPLNPGSLSLLEAGVTGASDDQATQLSVLPVLTHALRPDLFYSLKGRYFRVVFRPLDEAGRPKAAEDGTVGSRYGGEFQLDWIPVPGRYLTFGLTGDGNAVRSTFLGGLDGDPVRGQPEGAAFLQWEETVSERLRLTGGLRYDLYRIDRRETVRKLSPKLSGTLDLAEHLTFRAAYGQGFRVPSLAERFVNDQSFFPVIPNLRLRPEESTGYEVGLRSLLPAPGGALLQLDGALFWTDYRRLVEPTFVARPGGGLRSGFQFVNLTRARIRGAEAVAEGALPDERLRFRLGYTFLDARDLTEDRPLVFRARHLLQAGAAVRLLGPVELGLDYRFASRPERVDSDFARFVPDADVLVPTHVVDLRLEGRWRNLRAALLARNALAYYYLERPALLAPPRHYLLRLQADF